MIAKGGSKLTQHPIPVWVIVYLWVCVCVWWRGLGLWLWLGVLLWASERENYLSLFDTLISLHPMRLCSALCTLGSASFDCRNIHMCAKDPDVHVRACACVCEREKQLFWLRANQTRKWRYISTKAKFPQKKENVWQEGSLNDFTSQLEPSGSQLLWNSNTSLGIDRRNTCYIHN